MKTILRNFLSVARRFKTALFLNILGLGIAFAACMMILIQARYDYTFDHAQPHARHIFRADVSSPGMQVAIQSRPFARAFTASSPHIEAGALLSSWTRNLFFSVDRGTEKANYEEEAMTVTPGLTRVFHFEWAEGDDDALENPGTLLMPESMARRLFGPEPALGRALTDPDTGDTWGTVGGVYRDFPLNSTLKNCLYSRMGDKENYDAWGNKNYYFFFRLDDATHAEEVKENFKRSFDPARLFNIPSPANWEKNGLDLPLTSLADLHFLTGVAYDSLPKADRDALRVLVAIAFVIVLIAGINFTNFSTALTPMRIRSINTQKVLGSPVATLRRALLAETVGISLAAYLVALGAVALLRYTAVADLVDAEMALGQEGAVIGGTAVLALLVGVLAGVYPAWYTTSFPPALVLKGSFGLSPKGRRLRSLLVGIQFVASFVLIIAASFMFLQNRFMEKAPLGYEKDQLIVAQLNRKANERLERFRSEAKRFAGIDDVTFAEQVLSTRDQYMGWGRTYRDREIDFQCIPVSPSFLRVMGIEVLEGRGFRPEDDLKETGSYVFNRRAVEVYGLAVGERMNGDEIVGVMPDVKFQSFRSEVSPMAFYVWGKYVWGEDRAKFYQAAYIRVKAGSDMRAAMAHVKASLASVDAAYPFKVRFYDEILQRTYQKERQMGLLVSLFSLVAVFISMVGVFGLVLFESEYRRKEVGVRKVLGSTTGEILLMFNRSYLVILLVCFALGAPLAFYGVSGWLEQFAYRMPTAWWVFAAAFGAVAAVTAATVTYQNWRVANLNPAETVRSE